MAIGAVVMSHCLDVRKFTFAPTLGHHGVLLFFAISGFLITNRMLVDHAKNGSISLKSFYIRRFFRIIPPAAFMLVCLFLLGLAQQIQVSTAAIAEALFFLRNYMPTRDWYTGHFWSLSVEEHFYLVWPAILVAVGIGAARWVAPLLAAIVIAWRLLDRRFDLLVDAFHAPWLQGSFFRTDYMADILLWGCVAALLVGPRIPSFSAPRGLATAGTCGILGLVLLTAYHPPQSGGAALIHFLPVPLILSTIAFPRSDFSRMLESGILRWIGRHSYSIYLWQQLFFHGEHAGHVWQTFPLNLCLTLAAATLSYRFIERPTIRTGQRLLARRAATSAAARESLAAKLK